MIHFMKKINQKDNTYTVLIYKNRKPIKEFSASS